MGLVAATNLALRGGSRGRCCLGVMIMIGLPVSVEAMSMTFVEHDNRSGCGFDGVDFNAAGNKGQRQTGSLCGVGTSCARAC